MTRFLILSLVAVSSLSGQDVVRLSEAVVTQIDAAVSAGMKQQEIPGASVAVSRDGEVLLQKGYGLADLENSVRVTGATRFRTASIAKPMTAVAVMQLVEQGKLDLDAPIRRSVPGWPRRHAPVTARQLLCHTGGVRHYARRGEASGTKHFRDLASTLSLFANDDLIAPPGTRYSYTTYGFTLLGLAVERLSGQTFGDYLEERVWAPAGMTRSAVDDHFAILEDRARGYQKLDRAGWMLMSKAQRERVKPGAILNASLHDTSMKIPGGGLVSTAGDLCRFAIATMDGMIIKEAARDAMFTRQRLSGGESVVHGLGFRVDRARGTKRVSHSGGQAGTACYLAFYPERRLAVAVMTNLRGANTRALVKAVTDVIW